MLGIVGIKIIRKFNISRLPHSLSRRVGVRCFFDIQKNINIFVKDISKRVSLFFLLEESVVKYSNRI
jgi:hypothetical protein